MNQQETLTDIVKEACALVRDPDQLYKETLRVLHMGDPSSWYDGLLIPEQMLSFLLYGAQVLARANLGTHTLVIVSSRIL